MATTLQEKLQSLPPKRQEKIERLIEELVSEEMILRDLRKRQKLTQEEIAQLLGIKQENVSRLERRNNIHLSTLRD